MSFASIVSDLQSSTARSITLRSSRTLPWPTVTVQHFVHAIVDADDGLLELGREPLHEMLRQQADVIAACAQGRKVDRHHVQPIHQITPERTLFDGRIDVAVRRGDHPYVDRDFTRATHPPEAALLEEAQQLGL